jgi:hypothetical protein
MTTLISKRKWIYLSAITLIAASVITAGVFSARRQRPNQKPQKQVLALPPVISNVPKLRIANINVKNLGTPDAVAVIEILNTSHLPVMAVEISTKNQAGDSGGVNEDGLLDPEKPYVVIPPYGTKTLEISFSEMVPDAPLVLSAAVFAYGSEEGDTWSRDAMRAVRERHQELRRAEEKNRREVRGRENTIFQGPIGNFGFVGDSLRFSSNKGRRNLR